jgi:hypothetical protein
MTPRCPEQFHVRRGRRSTIDLGFRRISEARLAAAILGRMTGERTGVVAVNSNKYLVVRGSEVAA